MTRIGFFEISRRRFLAGTAATGAAAVAPRALRAQEPKILRVRSYYDLQVLDPCYRVGAPEDDITRCLLPGLIGYRPSADKWEWELEAAEAIDQIDDKTIAFKLRQGWMWTGGFGELTTEDVKFSFERIADPANKSPYNTDWATLEQIEIKDKYEGVIKLKEYFAPLWSTTLPIGSGRIVCKKAVEALPGKKFTTSVPASCGPYTLAEWQPKQRTLLKRNPDYKGPQPYFDEVHIHPIEDPKVALIGYEAGELDLTEIDLGSLANYKGHPPAGSRLINRPSLAYIWIGMNVEHPNLKDERVRKAIQRAIDPDAAIDAAYFGQAQRATGIVAPGLIGHRDRNLVSHDVADAQRLLAEAGVQNLSLTMHLLNTTDYVAMAQVVQASLAEVGINLELIPLDSGTFWTLGDQSTGEQWKTIQLQLGRFSMNPDPAWATEWFTPQQIGVWNWERWNNLEFGRLNEEGLHERDPKKRDVIYRRMQDLMEESGAYVFATHGASAFIHRATLKPAQWPDGKPVFAQFKAAVA